MLQCICTYMYTVRRSMDIGCDIVKNMQVGSCLHVCPHYASLYCVMYNVRVPLGLIMPFRSCVV